MDEQEQWALVEAWIAFARTERGTQHYDELFWSWEKLSKLTSYEPDVAWDVITKVLYRDEGDDVRDLLSAGPLESLLSENGSLLIGRVEQLASESPAFRDLLSGVWKNAIPDNIWKRIQNAVTR